MYVTNIRWTNCLFLGAMLVIVVVVDVYFQIRLDQGHFDLISCEWLEYNLLDNWHFFLAHFIVVFISSGFLDLSTETDADSGLSVQELIDMAKKELEKKKAAVVRKKSAANAPGQITNT